MARSNFIVSVDTDELKTSQVHQNVQYQLAQLFADLNVEAEITFIGWQNGKNTAELRETLELHIPSHIVHTKVPEATYVIKEGSL